MNKLMKFGIIFFYFTSQKLNEFQTNWFNWSQFACVCTVVSEVAVSRYHVIWWAAGLVLALVSLRNAGFHDTSMSHSHLIPYCIICHCKKISHRYQIHLVRVLDVSII